MIRVTVVYDNQEFDERLIPSHGFSCLVEVGGERILFDTGGNPTVLFYNLGVLGVNPRNLTAVVISHTHWDHVGGLSAVLSLNPGIRVVLPSGFAGCVAEGVHVVGPLEAEYRGVIIREQALAVETSEGAVLVVGCSHPGVGVLVREAMKVLRASRVSAVIGGFHQLEEEKAATVAGELLELGVERVIPCHCTGRRAVEAIGRVHRAVMRCGVGASFSF